MARTCELDLRRADGSTLPAGIETAFESGSGMGHSVISEITERCEVEKALRESQQDLNRAQAVAHVGSWRLDVRQNRLKWSDEIHRIFGIPMGTPLTYESFLKTVHPEDRIGVDNAWRSALRGAPYDIEHRIVANGAVKWVRERAEMEFDEQGALVGGFGTSEDITERKLYEERLRRLNAELEDRIATRTAELSESEAKFRTLAEESPNMIFISRTGRLLYTNPMCHRVTGYDAQVLESGGFDVLGLFSPDCAERMSQFLEGIPLGGDGSVCEASTATKDAKSRPVLVSARRIMYAGGPAILGILTDLTERKRMERVLERQRTALGRLAARFASAQDEEQRRIAEGLHDGVAQLLVAGTFKLAALRDSPDGRRCGPRLAEIEGLLNDSLTQIRTLAFELSAATLSRLGLGKALEELTVSMRSRHGVNFNLVIAGHERRLDGRAATILFKATRELMFNVIKHAGVMEASVTISWTSRGVRITVRDHGTGFRVSATRGHGSPRSLGLLSIEERMRSIGGRSAIKSKPGAGTQASLFLGTPQMKRIRTDTN